jgi:drug/metabolite transporter superfamily protein YnfA
VIAAQVGVFVPCALVFFRYVDSKPLLGWAAAVIGIGAYFALFGVVVWKTDTDYSA